jgi:type II restriction/modification system DNA methylase subunit YeeA
LTGYNDAFIIDTETRNRILANCKDEEERRRTEEIIKPVLRGRDIERYRYKWAGLWLIYIPWHFPLHHDTSISGASLKAEEEFKKKYPALYSYLLQFKDRLLKRNKEETGIRYEWYVLQRWASDYYPEFEKEKIVWQRVTKQFSFCLVPNGIYILDSMAFMVGKGLKYLLGILNCKLIDFYVKSYVHLYGDTGFLLSNQYVERIPIPPLTPQNQPIANQIITLVDQILSAKKQNPEADTSKLEKEIDELVYKLYNLTEEEIEIIEGEK